MKPLLHSPGLLLLAVGALLGLNFPLGKTASEAGVPGTLWAALISTGAALLLGVIHAARRRAMPLGRRYLRYFTATALVSYAVPNTLLFLVIPKLGSAMAAMLFALSPLITTGLARLFGLRVPRRVELIGIGIGLLGSLLVIAGRGEAGRPAEWLWLALGTLIPASLAVGNVYRSLDWPEGADGAWLAVGSNAAAAAMLIALCLVTGSAAGLEAMLSIPVPVAVQLAASTAMFLLFFRLQQVGGPVTLSQIGIVAAGVGTLIGAGALGERYPAIVWVGVALIALGLALAIAGRHEP